MFDLFDEQPQQKELRPHQVKGIDLVRSSLARKNKRPMLQLPTGGGKTLLAANIIRMAREKGNTVAFCVPAISLINQTVKEFREEGITEVGVIQADHPLTDYSQPVQICSVQTITRRTIPEFGLVIIDEAHKQFKAVYDWMERDAHVPFIGLSATPWSKGLGKHYDDLLIAATTRELIDAGYLSDYTIYAPSAPDLKGVKVTAGDYQKDELSQIMRDHKLVGDVVDSWKKLGTGGKTLCFCVDRAHAKAVQKQFGAAGIRFGYCDAHTDVIERQHMFSQMQRGEIAGIVNVGTLTTGVDTDVRTLILARPTKSHELFVQIIGRALRLAPGKDKAIIIDHSDTTLRLGLPCHIQRSKLSTGEREEAEKQRKQDAAEKKPKSCPKCKTVKPVGVHECPKCGFAPEHIQDVESAAGELAEVNSKPKFTREEKQRFYSGLLHIQAARRRSSGWVAHTYRNKFGVWPKGLDHTASQPAPEVVSFVKHKDIAFAKRRAKQ